MNSLDHDALLLAQHSTFNNINSSTKPYKRIKFQGIISSSYKPPASTSEYDTDFVPKLSNIQLDIPGVNVKIQVPLTHFLDLKNQDLIGFMKLFTAASLKCGWSEQQALLVIAEISNKSANLFLQDCPTITEKFATLRQLKYNPSTAVQYKMMLYFLKQDEF